MAKRSMTIIKSLRFGKNKNTAGYAHRIHRSKKRRGKLMVSKFGYRQRRRAMAEQSEKLNRVILQSAKKKLSTATPLKQIGV